MPLARGTAVVGYITLLALFLAGNCPITQPAPKVHTTSISQQPAPGLPASSKLPALWNQCRRVQYLTRLSRFAALL